MLDINDLKRALVNVDAYLSAKENSGGSFFLCNLKWPLWATHPGIGPQTERAVLG